MRTIIFYFVLCCVALTALAEPLAEPTSGSTENTLRRGALLQRQGYYLDARTAYHDALQYAINSQNARHQALAQAALGYIEYLLNHPLQAAPYLQQALDFARAHQDTGLEAITLYYQGLLQQSLSHPDQAVSRLEQSLTLAEKQSDALLVSRVHIALAQNAATREDLLHHQRQAMEALATVKKSAERGEIFLQLAEQSLEHPLFPPLLREAATGNAAEAGDRNRHLAYAYRLLAVSAQNLDPLNSRQFARYHAMNARLYESQQRYDEALQLIFKAIHHLEGEQAKDLLLFYEWQAGRLHKALGNRALARQSYRRAVSYLQDMRQDIPVTYHNGKSSFLELFGPLYRGLIGLLLDNDDPSSTQIGTARLQEVQALMERLRQTELEDFFQDRCLLTDFSAHQLTVKQPQLAVLYPIILDDRIELLLSIGNRFYRESVAISAASLESTIRRYSTSLRRWKGRSGRARRQFLKEGLQLYDILIKPLETQLNEQAIDTLVYIPDGPLRLLPLAALYDGQQYLIERLAISTIPSLSILPPPLRNKPASEALLVGLSRPSTESVAELPGFILDKLRRSTKAKDRSFPDSLAVRSASDRLENFETDPQTLSRKAELDRFAKVLSLPGVEQEIDSLSQIQQSHIMLNHDYTLNGFDQWATRPQYNIIHIASHGFFGNSSDNSFIMTYDKMLTLDHLEGLLSRRSSSEPIDLLVLSACQTAAGDDRAPLGISGIALKARAKTALGSLWPISDDAAVALMQRFYTGFQQQGLNKVKALQQAQLELLRNDRFKHPFFWSPFVLVGQWE